MIARRLNAQKRTQLCDVALASTGDDPAVAALGDASSDATRMTIGELRQIYSCMFRDLLADRPGSARNVS